MKLIKNTLCITIGMETRKKNSCLQQFWVFSVLDFHLQKVNICRKEKKDKFPGTTCYCMNNLQHTVNTSHFITHLICKQFTGNLTQNPSSWKKTGTQTMDCITKKDQVFIIWTPVYLHWGKG